MAARQRTQALDHAFGLLRQRPVGADEIRVVVDEPNGNPVQPSGGGEVEEERAAPEKGFGIRRQMPRHESPQLRQQLPLAARPLQKRDG